YSYNSLINYIVIMKMVPYEAFACRYGKADVVLRESYQPYTRDPDGDLMSTQKYMDKVVEDVGDDDDFKSAAWVSATNYVNTFGGTITGCLGDVNNFLNNGKLALVVRIVKSCLPNMLGDLNVTMKDLSGTIPGTIHHKVIGKGGYGNDITVGAAMILTNVSVFSPTPSKYYLNITMRNVVEVFRKDTVLGNGSG
nr:GPCR kinase [Tanacetum cinerariifolium]